jgi:hypothetical protein
MDGNEEQVSSWTKIFGSLFDATPAQVALLDQHGTILKVNKAWRDFGREHGLPPGYIFEGKNYLRICESAAERGEPSSQRAYLGLLEVLRTQRPKFTMVYPCHAATQKRWYRMWVEPQSPQVPVIVVAHYFLGEKPASAGTNQSLLGMLNYPPMHRNS